jgi:hypothetical protein
MVNFIEKWPTAALSPNAHDFIGQLRDDALSGYSMHLSPKQTQWLVDLFVQAEECAHQVQQRSDPAHNNVLPLRRKARMANAEGQLPPTAA